MITIEECKKHMGNLNLTDKQVEEVRNALYAVVEQAMDYTIQSGMIVPTK